MPIYFFRSISIAGHSAGAHLTISLFSNILKNPISCALIKNIYLISGVYDLKPLLETYINEPVKLQTKEAIELSPLQQTFKNISSNATFNVIVGEYESPAFIEQSKLFYEKLIGLKHGANIEIIDAVDHFNIVENLNNEDFAITQKIIEDCKILLV